MISRKFERSPAIATASLSSTYAAQASLIAAGAALVIVGLVNMTSSASGSGVSIIVIPLRMRRALSGSKWPPEKGGRFWRHGFQIAARAPAIAQACRKLSRKMRSRSSSVMLITRFTAVMEATADGDRNVHAIGCRILQRDAVGLEHRGDRRGHDTRRAGVADLPGRVEHVHRRIARAFDFRGIDQRRQDALTATAITVPAARVDEARTRGGDSRRAA